MAEVKASKEVKKEREAKKKLEPVVIQALDFKAADVVKFDKEGRKLFFADDKESFLELSDSIIQKLSPENKKRYRLAQQIFQGEDVIQNVVDGIRGWTKDYNVRPGSFSDNLMVFGKQKGFDYDWSTPAKLSNKVAQGWEVDRDPNVKTVWEDSSTLKTVGGEAKPELILLRRPKKIKIEERKKRKEKLNALKGQTKDNFVKTASDMGVQAFVAED